MLISGQFKLPSAVPKDRVVLTVREVASRWQIDPQHVVNLIQEGQLVAIDLAARRDCFPMPLAALDKLAARLNVTTDQLLEFIRTIAPTGSKNGRCLWRVPVVEGYMAFMEKRNSLTLK